ncbi:hypothetical protein [Streptomyces europaeiscabiei]|uniref:hypothetical protein n=1 Tax=Streptomyces europaeiscabiei TaxID=146819 RepID=UPI002E0D7440|nr:hypothetical protein OHB30_50415 [Streptomyces europaeiscabiei]
MHLIHVRMAAPDPAPPSALSSIVPQSAGLAAERPVVPEGLLAAVWEQAAGVPAVDHVSVAADAAGECVVGLFVTASSVAAAESVAHGVVERALAMLLPGAGLQVASSRAALVPQLLTHWLGSDVDGRSMQWPNQSSGDHWS